MKLYYDYRYTASSKSFDTTRKSSHVAELALKTSNVDIVSPKEASALELSMAHSIDYIEAVERGHEPLASSCGLRWDEGHWEMVAASTGGVLDAAFSALEDGTSGSLSSGLHHARWEKGEGYCTFNGLALAAVMLAAGRTRTGRRNPRSVLVLDLDAHCGGGTHSIIKNRLNISQYDVSVSPYDSYNDEEERHRLDFVMEAENYLQVIEDGLKKSGKVDVVLYNAGMDPHQHCEVGGLPGISMKTLRERENLVFDWCRRNGTPIAFVLAGGYEGEALSKDRLASLHMLTVKEASK